MGLKTSKNIRTAKAECDKWFSIWIRLRDADEFGMVKCVTCNKRQHWKDVHNGHFQGRRHTNTRWEPLNCSAQCAYCNTYCEGQQYKHGKALDARWGEGTADKMVSAANVILKLSKEEIMEMAREFHDEVYQNYRDIL